MGWWGVGIVDGDTPQDILCDLRERIRIAPLFDEDEEEEVEPVVYDDVSQDPVYMEAREKVHQAQWGELFTYLAEHYGDDYHGLIFQCITWLYLDYQIDIPEDLKVKVIQATEDDKLEASDYTQPEERIQALDAFIAAVQANKRDGLKESGLFWAAEWLPRTLFD